MQLADFFMINSGLEKYVDVADGLNRIRNNKTVYKVILNSFVKGNQFEEMKQQLEAGSIEDAIRSAHTLKGIAANLSLPVLYEVSLEAESQLKNGESVDDILPRMDEILTKTKTFVNTVLENLNDLEV